ncbi:STN domain-containing protein [Komagataeibacter rhaeticus]|nr:STN domain-containing protein [Komagataeibacter rhaeticus]
MTTTLAGLGGHAASAATAQTVAAPAPTSAQSFSIPAQKLGDALASFGAQSGWQVSVRADVIRNATSPGVSGRLMPADALSRLLAGTGFTYRLSGEHTVTLVPASANITLGPVRVGGTVTHENPSGPGVGCVATTTISGTQNGYTNHRDSQFDLCGDKTTDARSAAARMWLRRSATHPAYIQKV